MPERKYGYRNISIPKDLIRQAEELLKELEREKARARLGIVEREEPDRHQ